MKRIFFPILFLLSLTSLGQQATIITGDLYNRLDFNRQPKQLGILYNKNSWTSGTLASDFTQTGSPTVSVVSNKIQFSGGAGTYTQLLKLNGYPTASHLEHVRIVAKIKLGTLAAGGPDFGIGSAPSFVGSSTQLARGTYTTGNSGVSSLRVDNDYAGSFSTTGTASGTVTGSANDYILLTYQVDFPVVTVAMRNLTTGTAEISTTAIGGGASDNYTIFSLGGTFTLDSLVVSSTELVNAAWAAVGDSKTEGAVTTTYANRWTTLIGSYVPSIVNLGAGGDRTAEVLARINQIISLKPRKVLLEIGSNDLRGGVSEPTFETNYASISSQLIAAGIDVYYLLPFFETSEDQTTQYNYILANYPAAKIINTWSPTKVSGTLSGDGVHPNDAGHSAIARAIIQSGALQDMKYIPLGGTALTPNYVAYGSSNSTVTGSADLQYTTGAFVEETSINGLVYIKASNTSSGTAATGAILVANNSGHSGRMGINSSGYTTVGDFVADQFFITNSNAAAGMFLASQTGPIDFAAGGFTKQVRLNTTGNVGVGVFTDSAAFLQLGVGTTTKGPLKFIAGALLTSPKNGMMEFDGHLWITAGGVRYQLDQQSGGGLSGLTATQVMYATSSTAIAGSANHTWDNTNGVLTITHTSGGTDGLIITGSNGGRTGAYSRGTGAAGVTGYLAENDRGSFANFAVFGIAGSTSTIYDGQMGVTTAHDWVLLKADGANNLGMAIGTVSNTPMVFGTHNIEAGRINTSQHWLLGTTTDNGLLTVAGVAAPEANVTRDLGTSSFAWRDLYLSHPIGKSTIGGTSGLGTNVTSLTPSGNDAHFSLTVVTSGNVTGTVGLVAFGRTWGATPKCRISVADAATGAAVTAGYFALNATNTSSMTMAASLTGAGTYVFNCDCGQ